MALALSLLLHGLAGLALVRLAPQPPASPSRPEIVVGLVRPPSPAFAARARPAPAAKVAAEPAADRRARAQPSQPPPQALARRTPDPQLAPVLAAGPEDAVGSAEAGLTDAQLAGAATAGSGGGGEANATGDGGPCDMLRRLQAALRRDAAVQAAARGHAGEALLLWNGDWIASRGEDGRGLAVVRQALVFEIAFAPPACKTAPVRGLVLLSLADGPGATRLALGAGAWRWTDLLHAPGARSAAPSS